MKVWFKAIFILLVFPFILLGILYEFGSTGFMLGKRAIKYIVGWADRKDN